MSRAYQIKAHPTKYAGVMFRSRLEARWAAFFDLARWQWSYEPLDLNGWTPDFLVTFPCRHSECNGSHSLLVEVKPYTHLGHFEGHPCLDYFYGCGPADSSAAFGLSPAVTYWQMAHGAGGGEECVDNWVNDDVEQLWRLAGNRVQYQPQGTYR